jgi:hypothetical protein
MLLERLEEENYHEIRLRAALAQGSLPGLRTALAAADAEFKEPPPDGIAVHAILIEVKEALDDKTGRVDSMFMHRFGREQVEPHLGELTDTE